MSGVCARHGNAPPRLPSQCDDEPQPSVAPDCPVRPSVPPGLLLHFASCTFRAGSRYQCVCVVLVCFYDFISFSSIATPGLLQPPPFCTDSVRLALHPSEVSAVLLLSPTCLNKNITSPNKTNTTVGVACLGMGCAPSQPASQLPTQKAQTDSIGDTDDGTEAPARAARRFASGFSAPSAVGCLPPSPSPAVRPSGVVRHPLLLPTLRLLGAARRVMSHEVYESLLCFSQVVCSCILTVCEWNSMNHAKICRRPM